VRAGASPAAHRADEAKLAALLGEPSAAPIPRSLREHTGFASERVAAIGHDGPPSPSSTRTVADTRNIWRRRAPECCYAHPRRMGENERRPGGAGRMKAAAHTVVRPAAASGSAKPTLTRSSCLWRAPDVLLGVSRRCAGAPRSRRCRVGPSARPLRAEARAAGLTDARVVRGWAGGRRERQTRWRTESRRCAMATSSPGTTARARWWTTQASGASWPTPRCTAADRRRCARGTRSWANSR